MATTLATLRADVRGLAGLTKATPDEVDQLLVEADRELCTRSEWTRANVELGPTVADQAAYPVPSTVDRILRVWKDGYPLDESNENDAKRVATGEMRIAGNGIYWLSWDEDSVESVSVAPTPTDAQSLTAQCVVWDTDWEMDADGDVPKAPARFAKVLRSYALYQIFSLTEDNPELKEQHEADFERGVELLHRLRLARAGRGGARLRIEGVTA